MNEADWEAAAALHDTIDARIAEGDLPTIEEARFAAERLGAAVGPEHPDAANARVTVGLLQVALGEPVAALPTLAEARDALERWAREPVVRPMRVRARVAYADALRQAGRYAEAVGELRKAARMADGDPSVNNALGIALRFNGEYEAARRAYQRALAVAEGELRASIHHNLSGLAHARGDYAESEAQARQALSLRTERDAAYGADLGGLALALAEQGRHDEALAVFAEARGVYTEALPVDHPEWAYLEHNLGDTLVAAGRLAEAEAAYAEALRIKRLVLGAGHPEVAVTLANSRLAVGPELAAARVAAARVIVAAALAPDHPIRQAIEAID